MATVRERVRQEQTREIVAAARRQLATVGPVDLSLRAVAREVGLASSAVYRYFASRDDLLTALIVEAYDELGGTVERAEAAVPRADHAGRWLAVCTAARRWGLDHPHEFALVYGTPVPGYAAPRRTVAAAVRIPRLLVALLRDGLTGDEPAVEVPPAYEELLAFMGPEVPADRAVLGLAGWTWLIGRISFELHGHLHGVVDPTGGDAAYAWEVAAMGTALRLTG
jgi:AcrR family transcriptional regulator